MTKPDIDATGIGEHRPDSPDGGPAGEAAAASEATGQTPDSDDTNSEADDNGDGDHGDSAARKARREAAGPRKRLRDVEAERDQLRERIDAMLQDGIKNAIKAAGYGTEVVELIDTDALLDDNGALDRHKLQDAITSTARKYNIARKGPALKPNPQQGAYGSPKRQPGAGFRAAFAPRSR